MVVWLVQQVLYFRQALAADATPRQLAVGCTLGMVLGLIPKGNLIAVGLTMIVLAVRLNFGAAMLSTLCFSLVAPAFDPVTHRIGLALLGNNTLQGYWAALYELPMAPWSSFHNTVVLGSLVLGLAISIPFYVLTKRGFERLQRRRCSAKVAGLLAGPIAPADG